MSTNFARARYLGRRDTFSISDSAVIDSFCELATSVQKFNGVSFAEVNPST